VHASVATRGERNREAVFLPAGPGTWDVTETLLAPKPLFAT